LPSKSSEVAPFIFSSHGSLRFEPFRRNHPLRNLLQFPIASSERSLRSQTLVVVLATESIFVRWGTPFMLIICLLVSALGLFELGTVVTVASL